MINFLEFEDNLKSGKLANFYILSGFNEQLIKQNIKKITEIAVSDAYMDLNYVQYDGNKVTCEEIINACETLPFISDKKVVVIYRADFLSDNKKSMNKNGEEIIKQLSNYSIPEHCIFIMYYVFENDRDKISRKVKKFDKKAVVVEFTKLKGMTLQKKVKDMFDEKNKAISKAELSLFCSEVPNNMDIIKNEIEKLCAYTGDNDIKREDILALLPPKSNNDIFNLVDFISQKKPEKALEILDELFYRGETATKILSMIERQFKLMFQIKLGMLSGKRKDELSQELKLNPYICDKMMGQCTKYSMNQLVKAEELCINTEKELKSQSVNGKIKLELLILNSAII